MASQSVAWAVVDPPWGIGEDGGRNRNREVAQRNGNVLAVLAPNIPKLGYDTSAPGPDYFAELFRVSRKQIIFGCNYMPVQMPGPGRII